MKKLQKIEANHLKNIDFSNENLVNELIEKGIITNVSYLAAPLNTIELYLKGSIDYNEEIAAKNYEKAKEKLKFISMNVHKEDKKDLEKIISNLIISLDYDLEYYIRALEQMYCFLSLIVEYNSSKYNYDKQFINTLNDTYNILKENIVVLNYDDFLQNVDISLIF